MPKVRRSRKPPPDGWELIEPTLDELDQKMREGEPTFLFVRMSHVYYCAGFYVIFSLPAIIRCFLFSYFS